MMKLIKVAMLLMAVSSLVLAVYCVVVIYEAHSYTEQVIKEDIANHQWRIKGGAPRKYELDVGDMSASQIDALITVQDPSFYQHNGVDLSTPGAGITTISQAIAKKLYFEEFKPGFAKLKQTLIARFVIDAEITKQQQLGIFVNLAYLGQSNNETIYGLERAAKQYYGKTTARLYNDEYLSLVAMLIAPSTFNVEKYPGRNKRRVERIKALLTGEYVPKGLMDVYYGELAIDSSELPTFSKF